MAKEMKGLLLVFTALHVIHSQLTVSLSKQTFAFMLHCAFYVHDLYLSNAAFMNLNGCHSACHTFVVTPGGECAPVMICFIFRQKDSLLCAQQRQRSTQQLSKACWGELLDLSCQPFTHNVSFMNVSCADLIPFRAE